jgi:hypothetical protein
MPSNAPVEFYLQHVWPEARAANVRSAFLGQGKSPRHRKIFRVEALEKFWRVEVADTPESRYYLRRSARWSRYLQKEIGDHRIVAPFKVGACGDAYLTVTAEIGDAEAYNNDPADWMLRMGKSSTDARMSTETLRLIERGFLRAWPPELREHIKRLDRYSEWLAVTSSLKQVVLVLEHGDLAPNNILHTPKGPMLLDFEFVKLSQVSGFDRYSNLKARKLPADDFDVMHLEALHRKWELIQVINNYWENHCIKMTVTTKKQSISFAYVGPQCHPQCATGVITPSGRIVFDRKQVTHLEVMESAAARALVHRWVTDGQRVMVPEIASSCYLFDSVRPFSFKNSICGGVKSGKILRILRRLAVGRQLFAYTLKRDQNRNVVTLALGNICDYLRDRLTKQ